jgi:TFX-like DNA-binding protein
LQQIPMIVLQEADKHGIHLRSNMVEILRMVKKLKANSLGTDGRINEKLIFNFNERGKLFLR